MQEQEAYVKMAGKGIVVNVAAGESKLIRGAQTAVLKPGEMVSIGRPLGGLLRYFTSSLWDDIKQNVAGNDAKKKTSGHKLIFKYQHSEKTALVL
jgi:hypothetical protein